MVLKMKIKKLLVELVDAVELVGNPRKCLETTRGCAVVPGGHEPSHEHLSWELTWRLGRGTRGGTFIILLGGRVAVGAGIAVLGLRRVWHESPAQLL